MNLFICYLADCVLMSRALSRPRLCSNTEAIELHLGFPGNEEGQGMLQGVWAKGEARRKQATGSPEMLGTSQALHSLKAATIKASWKEGVRRSPGQGLQGKRPPDLLASCVRKHCGSCPEKEINKSNGTFLCFPISGIRGDYFLG